MNLPVSYIALKLGAPVESTAIIYCLLSIIALVARLILAKKLVGISISFFLKDVLLKVCLVSLVSAFLPLLLCIVLQPSFIRLVIVVVISTVTTSLSIYALGCNESERELISAKFISIYDKLLRRSNDKD